MWILGLPPLPKFFLFFVWDAMILRTFLVLDMYPSIWSLSGFWPKGCDFSFLVVFICFRYFCGALLGSCSPLFRYRTVRHDMRNAGFKIVSHASWDLVGADSSYRGLQSRVIFFGACQQVSDSTVLVGQLVVNMLRAFIHWYAGILVLRSVFLKRGIPLAFPTVVVE